MTVQIQRHGFFVSVITLIFLSGLCGWGIYYGTTIDPELNWLAGIAALFMFAIFLGPLRIAYDLSNEIPEVKELKETNGRFKKVRIRHSSFWWVVIWTVAALFTFGLTWFVALFLVSGAINVEIPDDVAVASGLKAAINDPNKQIGRATSSEELLRWKKLLDEGVISEEEFEAKKKALL